MYVVQYGLWNSTHFGEEPNQDALCFCRIAGDRSKSPLLLEMKLETKNLEAMVQELYDRQAIRDCLMAYSRGVDRLDRELILSVYHEDAIDDHGAFVGGPVEFADWVIAMHTATHMSHQHCQFNSTCELNGDVAHTETYYMFVGINQKGTPLAMSGGRYIDRLEKRNGRWAIAARLCVRDWAPLAAIPETLDQAALTVVQLDESTKAKIRGGAKPARDRTDPSYQRPLPVRTSHSS